jgi:hypothetical protein
LASARSAKVGTGFASDRALIDKMAHNLIGEPGSTSPDYALPAAKTRGRAM